MIAAASLHAWLGFPGFILLAGLILFVLPAWLVDRVEASNNHSKDQ